MSRWKCTVPFGWPVVPEVKAISPISSRRSIDIVETGRLAGHGGVEIGRPIRTVAHGGKNTSPCAGSAPVPWRRRPRPGDRCPHRKMANLGLFRHIGEFAGRAGAASLRRRSRRPSAPPSSRPPIIGLFGPRSSTRWPVSSPISSTSTRATASAFALDVGIGPDVAVIADAGPSGPAQLRDRFVEQFDGRVHPVRIGRQFPAARKKSKSGHRSLRRQAVRARRYPNGRFTPSPGILAMGGSERISPSGRRSPVFCTSLVPS